MYLTAYDPNGCILLCYVDGSSPEEEWEDAFATTKRLDQDAAQRGSDSLMIMLIKPGAERPNATRRRRMAEARTRRKARRHLAVFISDSLLLRGFLKTLDWISPRPANEENGIVATFAEAVAWSEEKRGRPLPELWSLYQELQSKLSARSARA